MLTEYLLEPEEVTVPNAAVVPLASAPETLSDDEADATLKAKVRHGNLHVCRISSIFAHV